LFFIIALKLFWANAIARLNAISNSSMIFFICYYCFLTGDEAIMTLCACQNHDGFIPNLCKCLKQLLSPKKFGLDIININ
jgi:hypothetical protein